jgi:hypothetical protein
MQDLLPLRLFHDYHYEGILQNGRCMLQDRVCLHVCRWCRRRHSLSLHGLYDPQARHSWSHRWRVRAWIILHNRGRLISALLEFRYYLCLFCRLPRHLVDCDPVQHCFCVRHGCDPF